MGLKCFKFWKPCDLTGNVHLHNVISNKYEYLKPRGRISVEYDVDTESHILRILLDQFLKNTIELQPLELESKVELVGSKHFLRNIEASENSESSEIMKVLKILKILV